MSGSLKRLNKKSSTSLSFSGPPRFKNKIPTLSPARTEPSRARGSCSVGVAGAIDFFPPKNRSMRLSAVAAHRILATPDLTRTSHHTRLESFEITKKQKLPRAQRITSQNIILWNPHKRAARACESAAQVRQQNRPKCQRGACHYNPPFKLSHVMAWKLVIKSTRRLNLIWPPIIGGEKLRPPSLVNNILTTGQKIPSRAGPDSALGIMFVD